MHILRTTRLILVSIVAFGAGVTPVAASAESFTYPPSVRISCAVAATATAGLLLSRIPSSSSSYRNYGWQDVAVCALLAAGAYYIGPTPTLISCAAAGATYLGWRATVVGDPSLAAGLGLAAGVTTAAATAAVPGVDRALMQFFKPAVAERWDSPAAMMAWRVQMFKSGAGLGTME